MTRRSSTPRVLVALALAALAFPGAAADQADHHAFIGGTSIVPAGGHVAVQINHTFFQWATLWYSARVTAGPPIAALMADAENRDRLEAGQAYAAIPGTSSGPAAETGGLASALPSGIYFLVLLNPGATDATVKWEVFLEPRLTGEAGAGRSPEPWYAAHAVPLGVALVAAAGVILAGWRIRQSRKA